MSIHGIEEEHGALFVAQIGPDIVLWIRIRQKIRRKNVFLSGKTTKIRMPAVTFDGVRSMEVRGAQILHSPRD